MAGEFGQFKPREAELSEAKLSAVTSVQAPTQDTSGATFISTIAQSISDLGKGAMTVFQASEQADEKQRALDKEEAFKEQEGEFETELLRAKAIADQHGSQSLGFKTFLTMAFDQSQLDFGTKTKMLKDFESTVLGKSFTNLSPEEEAKKSREKAFGDSLYWEYGASPEKQDENFIRFEKARAEELKRDLEIKEAQHRVAKAADDKRARDVEEQKLSDLERDKMKGIIRDSPHTLYNAFQNEKRSVQVIAKTQGTAAAVTAYKERVDKIRNSALNNIDNIAAQTITGLPVQRDLAKEIVNRLADVELKWEGAAEESKEAKAQKDLTITKAEVATLEDMHILSSTVIESLIPGSSVFVQKETPRNIKNAKTLIKKAQEREDGGRVPDLDHKDQEGQSFTKLTRSMLENVGKFHPDGSEKVDPEVAGKSVSAHLAYIGSLDEQTDIKDMRQSISILTDPEFARFVREHPETLGSKDMANAQRGLTSYQERVGQSTFNLLTKTISAEERSKNLGRYAKAHAKVLKHEQPTEEGLDIQFVNGQVVVVATAVGSRQVARELTEKVNGPLTEVINASAALSKQSAESIFNEWLPSLWPSKYGEQEPTEDGEYVDEATGERFTIKGGSRVEAEDFSGMQDGVYRDKKTGQTFEVRSGVRTDV